MHTLSAHSLLSRDMWVSHERLSDHTRINVEQRRAESPTIICVKQIDDKHLLAPVSYR